MGSFFASSGNRLLCAQRHSRRNAGRLRIWVGVAALWLALTGLASAQDEKDRARSLFAEGVSAFDRSDFSQALEFFTQAYRLAPHPVVRVNVANCYERLGRHPEAVFNYQRFLEEGGASIAAAQREEVEAAIERLSRKFGVVVVELVPLGATLSVDGETAARGLDGRLTLSVGGHRFRVTNPGFRDAERTVIVEGGSVQTVRIELESEEAAFVAQTGRTDAYLEEEEEAEPTREPAEPSRPLRTWTWVALGTSAAMGIGATVTGLLALDAQRDFDEAVGLTQRTLGSEAERAEARAYGIRASDRTRNLAVMTDVLTAGAIVGVSTAFVLWLFDRKRDAGETRAYLVRPEVSPHGMARITLQGAF